MMDAPNQKIAELEQLLWRMRDGAIDADGRARIEALVTGEADVRRFYIRYSTLCGGLRWLNAGEAGPGARNEGRVDSELGVRGSGFGVRGSEYDVGAVVELPHPLESQILNPPFPSLSTTRYPLPTTQFVGGPVFSYTVAAVIVGAMILGAWAYKITHYRQIADAPSPSASSSDRPELVFVGRITGMVDCRWADPQTEAYAGASVPIGRKYALSSGLMEVTYTTGAKVILQGPCTFEVESNSGGYLALGKLTAKVENKRSEVRCQRSVHYPLSTIHYPLFAVRTPTAIVTDLGTEFGVEVSRERNTTSHVFRGSVKVQVVAGDRVREEVVLRENESVRVEKGEGKEGNRLVLKVEATGASAKFVRRLYEPPKLLDLLDIVAGGNGTGRRRERGIDPLSGRVVPEFIGRSYGAGRQYWYVPWSRLIDGVFVPDGSIGNVQIDSTGTFFGAFPQTDRRTYGCIWSRAVEIDPQEAVSDNPVWIYQMGRGGQFTSDRRGLLCLHPNAGITFDLAEMRRIHSGVVIDRFRAVVGNVDSRQWSSREKNNVADVWILVDGRLKLKRERFGPQDGPFEVEVPLKQSDRFLTITATDGGDTNAWDWVVFRDPVLEITPTEGGR